MQAQDITADAIDRQLRQSLSPSHLEVIDESAAHAGHVGANGSGFGTHFRVRIRASALAGRTRVAQHRLVYDSLRQFLDAGLHALAIEVLPEPSGTISV
ncbi:BolA/IbaG family iron-sulfur metabolism protein [Xylophilus sp. Kf1]|nr:BolA/IbaG family iron-sulfur metabolism protein [Xylophilus sp. Kf1]